MPVTLLAETLLRRGHTLIIFTLDAAVREEVILTGPRLKICVGPYRSRHRARDFFRAERAYLQQAMRRENPPLINAHWTYEYALPALDSGIPAIITARDAPFTILRLNPTPYRFMRTLMAMKVARNACTMTANSTYTAEYWQNRMCFRGRMSVIPNGVPESLFSLAEKRPLTRPDHTVTFGMVLAGWGGRKNPKRGIESFGRLRKNRPDVRLCMFGRGYGPNQQAWRWARRRGFSDGIDFVGPLKHGDLMQRLAEDIDVLVHPALEESFGNTLIEAMAMGVPVIGGRDSGAVPWVLDQGRAGLLTNVRSSKALAGAMQTLADDPARRNELSRTARKSARQRFSMDRIADMYEQLYTNFSDGRRGFGIKHDATGE